eukprot:3709219-Rhodomonas_salina.4
MHASLNVQFGPAATPVHAAIRSLRSQTAQVSSNHDHKQSKVLEHWARELKNSAQACSSES